MQLLLPALAHQSKVMRLNEEACARRRQARTRRNQRGRPVSGLPTQPHMNLRVFRTADEAAHAAAAAVAAPLARKPASVLGLPTGRTSLAVYDELVRLHETGEADFSRAHTFNLDEFVGLPSTDRRTYCAFMQKHLFTRINLPSRPHPLPERRRARSHRRSARGSSARSPALGGMDLLLLGIGANAHIGFNEPGRCACTRGRIRRRLALATRRANASLFGGRLDRVPREALTMGDRHDARRARDCADCDREGESARGRHRCSKDASRPNGPRRFFNCTRTSK